MTDGNPPWLPTDVSAENRRRRERRAHSIVLSAARAWVPQLQWVTEPLEQTARLAIRPRGTAPTVIDSLETFPGLAPPSDGDDVVRVSGNLWDVHHSTLHKPCPRWWWWRLVMEGVVLVMITWLGR